MCEGKTGGAHVLLYVRSHSSLKSILAASTDFLVKILSVKELACLCLNVFKLFPGKFKLSKLAMKQLLTLSNDPIVIEYLKQVRNFKIYIFFQIQNCTIFFSCFQAIGKSLCCDAPSDV